MEVDRGGGSSLEGIQARSSLVVDGYQAVVVAGNKWMLRLVGNIGDDCSGERGAVVDSSDGQAMCCLKASVGSIH